MRGPLMAKWISVRNRRPGVGVPYDAAWMGGKSDGSDSASAALLRPRPRIDAESGGVGSGGGFSSPSAGIGKSRSVSRSGPATVKRSEEHTSELQSRLHLVCRLLLEKKKK